jgi:hypothetical protein
MADLKVGLELCGFCDRKTEEAEPDSCKVTVETTGTEWPLCSAHGAGFKSGVTKDVPADLSPAHS